MIRCISKTHLLSAKILLDLFNIWNHILRVLLVVSIDFFQRLLLRGRRFDHHLVRCLGNIFVVVSLELVRNIRLQAL